MAQASTFQPWIEAGALVVPDGVTDETKTAAAQMATDVLFQLSGRQWPGTHREVVYPQPGWCSAERPPYELLLPFSPVVSVEAVTIDGVDLDPAEYRVVNERILERLPDGDGIRRSWPSGGGWSIDYTHGALPPVGGVQSARVLAEQLAIAFTPNADGCRLGARTRSLARQGVTQVLDDPLVLFREGGTGLREVDLWLSSLRHGESGRPGAVVDVAGGTGGRPARPRFRRY